MVAALVFTVGWVVFQPKESGGSALPLSDDFEATAASAPLRPATTTTVREGAGAAAEPPLVVPPGGSLVATALQVEGEVAVWATPDAAADPTWMLTAETEFWGPRHFLVLEDAGEWLRVAAPV